MGEIGRQKEHVEIPEPDWTETPEPSKMPPEPAPEPMPEPERAPEKEPEKVPA